jgi:DNA modification methylase
MNKARKIRTLMLSSGGMDPHCGSGTSFIAALSNKRRFIGSELSPAHFKNACTRIVEALDGLKINSS